MRAQTRPSASIAAGAAAFILNPALACGPSDSEPEWEFGESEMEAAVVGTWTGTRTCPGGTTNVTLVLAQAAEGPGKTPASAHTRPACGSRSFVKEAAACVETTSMPLVGTLDTGDGTYVQARVSGEFFVLGTKLTHGELSLRIDGAVDVFAAWQDGTFDHGTFTDAACDRGTLVLDERAP